MSAIIAAALGLAEQVASIIATDNARALVVSVQNIRLAILAEENKGYDSDDAKLETLYQQAQILIQSASSEFALNAAKQ